MFILILKYFFNFNFFENYVIPNLHRVINNWMVVFELSKKI